MRIGKAANLILLTVLLFFPLAAYADVNTPSQTISTVREQAASGWHKTYEAHGRLIVVDIPIQVPEVETFPVIAVVPMPAMDSIPITDWHGYNQGNDKFFNETGFFRWDNPTQEIKAEAARKNLKVPPRGMDVKPIIRHFNQLEWDTAYSFNNSSTVRDADMLIKAKWNEYFPAETISLMPHWVHAYGEMRLYDDKADVYSGEPWPDFQGPLMVYFDQIMRGIPLLCHAAESFTRYAGPVDRETREDVGGIAITQGLKDIGLEETFYSMQYHLMKEQQEIAADIPLCSLEQAIAAYEQLIMDGKLRTVESLRLGYVVWYNKGEPESYTLLPMWVLEGELFKDADTDYQVHMTQSTTYPLEYGPLLVNAQTGEYINPWNSSLSRSFDKPDILTWK